MRKLFLAIAVLAASGTIAETALARKVSFQATVSQVRAACSKAGGSFGVHLDGGGYGCTKANCDGKGGVCIVACNNNNSCNGETPNRTAPSGSGPGSVLGSTGTVKNPAQGKPVMGPMGGGILDSGPVFSSQGPSATGSPAGGGKPPSAPPAAPPVILR